MGGKRTFANAFRTGYYDQMTATSEAVESLIKALSTHPSVTRDGAYFAPATEARFHGIRPDTLTWDWCDRNSAERGLRAALAYYDLDGQIVSVALSVASKQVTEIELWRGDGTPILSVPSDGDVWEVVPGQVYSPRA